jgi:hypothetical protein
MNRSTGSTGGPETAATPPASRRCQFCGGSSLRRSRLRATDVPWLLLLHWPVRCRRCSKRQHVFLTEAQRIIAAGTHHIPQQQSQESWQDFTANQSPALRSDQHDQGER